MGPSSIFMMKSSLECLKLYSGGADERVERRG
jgi:hypothetical protein